MASLDRHRQRRRPRGLVLEIEAGQVVCPSRGPTNIEQCFVCPASRGFLGGLTGQLVCTGGPERDFPFLVGQP